MMIRCREASKLSSEALDHPLPWGKRFALKFHLSMCQYCRRYARQLRFLHHILDLGEHELEASIEGSLSEEAKERILAALRQGHPGGEAR